MTHSIMMALMCSHLSGSQNQKKGARAPKIPKHNAETWGEALSPLHANVCVCDEYSLPLERRYRDTHFIRYIETYIIHLLVVRVALDAGLLLGSLNSTCPARINLFIN